MLTPQQDSEQEIERLCANSGKLFEARTLKARRSQRVRLSPCGSKVCSYGRKYTHRRTSRTAVHDPASGGSWMLVLGAGLFIFIPAVALVLGILGLIGVSRGFGINTNRNSHP